MPPTQSKYDYDLVVIGGGSGGLAASKEAADIGKRVAVCDFVTPTPKGTTWGLGGTCVNVGCIPKKLMHQAALVGQAIQDSKEYGWTTKPAPHDWNKLVETVRNHIAKLNWGYRVALRNKKVTYLNAFASLEDPHTIRTVDKRGNAKTITTDKIILATGLRPRYPDIPGAKEFAITSDDLFTLPHEPGDTLCVGASYVSLECAGFLKELGYNVTVMVRSILLRGFDQQMAEMVGSYMAKHGVVFQRERVPVKIEKIPDVTPTRYRVTSVDANGQTSEQTFNTVLFAIGRDACTKNLGLEKCGVKLNPKNGKVICNEGEQSSASNIYAIGDILDGKLELTPVAIQAGIRLVRRIFGASTLLTDYVNVPTTVFTPLEYGCCGYSEEDAIAKFGADNIEVFHQYFTPLEFEGAGRATNECYSKLICIKSENNRVVGFHIISPNAGEITQGYALGLKLGAKKTDFDELIGIHPTVAEVFTTLSVTKRENAEPLATGC